MMTEISKSIKDKLTASKIKLTAQRLAILSVLVAQKNRFISAEEIHSLVGDICENTNMSTIYRNLEVLEAAEIIEKTILSKNLYVYRISDQAHKHCIICKSCGKTESIEFCPLHEVNKHLASKDFTLTDHKFELYGYCKNCENKIKE